MTKITALFSGQGAQKIGMGANLIDSTNPKIAEISNQIFSQADQTLDFDLKKAILEGTETELTRTSICQPALYTHGILCLKAFQALKPDTEITASAGLSLGEFTAHHSAETFDFATGLEVVAQRGQLMETETEKVGGSMAALIGGTPDSAEKLAQNCNVEIANYNAPGQIVISGNQEGIDKAIASAKNFGIKIAKKIDVAGAYHSKLMLGAEEKFANTIAENASKINLPKIPVPSNFLGKPASNKEELQKSLIKQITGSVRWTNCIQYLIDNGHENFIEFGPGKVLQGLMKRIDRSVKIISIEDQESLETAINSF